MLVRCDMHCVDTPVVRCCAVLKDHVSRHSATTTHVTTPSTARYNLDVVTTRVDTELTRTPTTLAVELIRQLMICPRHLGQYLNAMSPQMPIAEVEISLGLIVQC